LGENLMLVRNFTSLDTWYFNKFEIGKLTNYTVKLDEIKVYVGTTEAYSDLNETISPEWIVDEDELTCYGSFCSSGEDDAPFVNCNIVPECCHIEDGVQVVDYWCAMKFMNSFTLFKMSEWIKSNWFYFVIVVFAIVLMVPLYLRYIKKHGE